MLRKIAYPFTFVFTFIWVVITDILSGVYYLLKKGYPAVITVGAISLVIYLIACAFSQSWAPGYPDFRWYAIVFAYSWIPCLILGIFFLFAHYRHVIIETITKWFEGTKLKTEKILQVPPTDITVPPNPRPKQKPLQQQQRGRFE